MPSYAKPFTPYSGTPCCRQSSQVTLWRRISPQVRAEYWNACQSRTSKQKICSRTRLQHSLVLLGAPGARNSNRGVFEGQCLEMWKQQKPFMSNQTQQDHWERPRAVSSIGSQERSKVASPARDTATDGPGGIEAALSPARRAHTELGHLCQR